jgi:hypothetical protein
MALYQMLFTFSGKGNVVCIDDADDLVKKGEAGVKLLKAALDTKKKRWLTWHSSKEVPGAPKSFEYEGSVCVISQHNLQALKDAARSKAEHYNALETRTISMHVNIETQQARLTRIKYVARDGHLFDDCPDEYMPKVEQQEAILPYMEDNMNDMRQFSMRTPHTLAEILASDPDNWQDMARYSKLFKGVGD